MGLTVPQVCGIAFLCAVGIAMTSLGCEELYRSYTTGEIFVHARYSHHGWNTTYSQTPILFIVNVGKYMLYAVIGISIIGMPLEILRRSKDRQARGAQKEP